MSADTRSEIRGGGASAEERLALGRALEARADEIAVLTARRAFPGIDTSERHFATSALASRIVARWLATGRAAEEDEHDRLARNGDSPLVGGASLADLTKSYLAWREATVAVLRQEADCLGIGAATLDLAIRAVEASCDSSLVRMARQFDRTRADLQRAVDEERRRLITAALQDRLTGLANRVHLLDRLHAVVASVDGRRERSAVLFIDIDHFKTVNDHLGHAVGDDLLVAVARRLAEVAPGSDTIARFGGDEFVILVTDLDDPDHQSQDLAEQVRLALTEPFVIDRRPVMITASIGLSCAADFRARVGAEELLTRADQAMYDAKHQGRNRVAVYTAGLGADTTRRSELAQELHFALARQQLVLHYQPVCTLGGEVVGAEALLRWFHPRLGSVAPAEFVPLAEESGLISAIGAWVIREAAAQCGRWLGQGLRAAVSVNVSAVQLRPPLVEELGRALSDHGLPPRSLTIELTEGALVADDHETTELFGQLGRLGVGLSIDDFGTGYSSLAYLRQLPVDALKIDRRFVAGIDEQGPDTVMLRTMIELGHNLGLVVVAEGVETDSQLDTLGRLGCDFVQGYLLGRPGPAEQLRWQRAALTGAR